MCNNHRQIPDCENEINGDIVIGGVDRIGMRVRDRITVKICEMTGKDCFYQKNRIVQRITDICIIKQT